MLRATSADGKSVTAMEQNPYQSPIGDLTNPADLLPSQQRLGRRRPILMAAIGVFVGGGTAVVCGGCGAALLGLLAGPTLADPTGVQGGPFASTAEVALVGGMMGAIYGGMIGLPIGAIAGLTSGLAIDRQNRVPIYVAAILSALGGGIVGTMGGLIVGLGRDSPPVPWAVGGALIGIFAGILGGTFMGVMIRRINHRLRPYADGLEQTTVTYDRQ